MNLKVIDGGPGCSVEDSAKKQIVDASYSTCKHFTGSTSCGNFFYHFTKLLMFIIIFIPFSFYFIGWSDKIKVTCKKTSYTIKDTVEEVGYIKGEPKIPLGPCSYNSTFAIEKNVPMCGFDKELF